MNQMKIEDVIVRVSADDPSRVVEEQRIVLLKEETGERLLPIWMGATDGNALAFRLTGDSPPRPVTSDLMVELLRVTGGRIERVVITALRDKTFYAVVVVAVDGRTEELDARPSDAMNLAIRIGAPVLVDEKVLDEAGSTRNLLPDKLDCDAEDVLMDLLPGRWTSLSAELLQSLHAPPGTSGGAR